MCTLSRNLLLKVVWLCFSDLQSCVLSSVELQVLTSSCFKLRTVHNIPVTSNKDGKELNFFFVCCLLHLCFSYFTIANTMLTVVIAPGSVWRWLEPKSVFCHFSVKSQRMGGALCRRECRLQYVSHPAHGSLCHAVCWLWPVLISQFLYVCICSRFQRCTILRTLWCH